MQSVYSCETLEIKDDIRHVKILWMGTIYGVKVGSHDPFFNPIMFLALSHLKEMLTPVTNFFAI